MLSLISDDISSIKTDALIIPVCEDSEIHDQESIRHLEQKVKSLKEFKGEKDDTVVLYREPGFASERIILSGIGKKEQIDPETLRSFAGKCMSRCRQMKLSDAVIAAPCFSNITFDSDAAVQAVLEGAFLGNHTFDAYKNEKKQQPVEKIQCHVPADAADRLSHLPVRVETIGKGTIQAREWVSMPSNDKNPETLAGLIKTYAENHQLKVTILTEDQLKEQKFGAILAVSSGSQSKPVLMMIDYRPQTAVKTIVLVGKGITFDAGGINLKPEASLDTMKCDMAGAATVAAVISALADLQYKHAVTAVIPMAENMPSGSATRPGDIIKTWSGKTVEIGNTDAEGRLILADAISYAIQTYKPAILIDVATLTGACVVALGEKIAGVFSPDDQLAQMIVDSGKTLHERCWRLPLPDDYKDLYKSDIADINNTSETRYGGAIIGALFIAEFVKDTRWAHIDIAGPAFASEESAYCKKGGTGFGVRLLCDVLEKIE